MPALQEAPPKSCPKCRGSMIVERDWHGTYGSCIMCGYVHEVLTSPPVDLAAEEVFLYNICWCSNCYLQYAILLHLSR